VTLAASNTIIRRRRSSRLSARYWRSGSPGYLGQRSYDPRGISRVSFGQSIALEDTLRFGPFLGLALLLFFLWIGGFVFFHVAGFLIHLLLIFAVVFLVIHLFTGAKTA
jgi:hypothetical protein